MWGKSEIIKCIRWYYIIRSNQYHGYNQIHSLYKAIHWANNERNIKAHLEQQVYSLIWKVRYSKKCFNFPFDPGPQKLSEFVLIKSGRTMENKNYFSVIGFWYCPVCLGFMFLRKILPKFYFFPPRQNNYFSPNLFLKYLFAVHF